MGSRRLLPVAALLSLALAPAALADAFGDVYDAYREEGRIDACSHSEEQLEQAARDIPNDIDAYAPEFRDALQAALEFHAGGGCDEDPAQGGAPAPVPGAPTTAKPAAPGATVTPSPVPDPTTAPAASDEAIARSALSAEESGAGTPAPVVALGVLGALIALGGLVYGASHWLAWDPRWARRLRHSLAEAGWRTGNTWSEFADWVRLGR